MQPFTFVPWEWRDPALLTGGYGATADYPADEERTDSIRADERANTEIAGYHIEAIDGGIGSIDEASYDVGSAYLVVDTGPWIFGRKVLLPAGTVQRVDHDARTVYVDRTKDQIKDSPEYDKEPSPPPTTATRLVATTPRATATRPPPEDFGPPHDAGSHRMTRAGVTPTGDQGVPADRSSGAEPG